MLPGKRYCRRSPRLVAFQAGRAARWVQPPGVRRGEGQSLERPFGHANPADLFAWAGATASWVNRTDPGGSRGLDDYFTRDMTRNIGAEIMGRNKFGPQRGP
jgi:hypothetical protein